MAECVQTEKWREKSLLTQCVLHKEQNKSKCFRASLTFAGLVLGLLLSSWKCLKVIYNRIAMRDWISKCNICANWWLLLSANLLRDASSASRDWKYQEYSQWHCTQVNTQVGFRPIKIMSLFDQNGSLQTDWFCWQLTLLWNLKIRFYSCGL